MKNKLRIKLFAAGMSFVIALVLIVTTTFAWFTMQTSVEVNNISITIGGTGEEYPFELSYTPYNEESWSTELTLCFNNADGTDMYGQLRPISTSDMKYWYLPIYSGGNVTEFYLAAQEGSSELPIDGIANHSSLVNGVTSELGNSNYIIYTDFYIRTRDRDSTFILRLNNPAADEDGSIDVQDEETIFGTYVLAIPSQAAVGFTGLVSGTNIPIEDGTASLRIGFVLYDEEARVNYISNAGITTNSSVAERDTAEASANAVALANGDRLIYEPNANLRSDFSTGEGNNLVYRIAGSGDNSSSYEQVSAYTDSNAQLNYTYDTYVPSYDENTNRKYSLVKQSTLRQTYSMWRETGEGNSLENLESTAEINSTYLASIGGFISTSQASGQIDASTQYISTSSLPEMAKISYNVKNDAGEDVLTYIDSDPNSGEEAQPYRMYQKVRVYFWIEGQDIDCWNQIAGSSLYANFEFRGDEVLVE